MAEKHRTYWAFMLRLWRVTSGNAMVWRASLEDPGTGERKGFADLESLLAFLKGQGEIGVDSPQVESPSAGDSQSRLHDDLMIRR